MLYSPTNITPSALSGLGNGTVDITDGLTVSWQVNGNSAMTAFKIDVCKNDSTSEVLLTTGKVTDNCPFYGTNYIGEIEFFSYTFDSTELSALSNGNTYKLIITQWWSSTEYVVQPSASVFTTKDTPTISIDTLPSPIVARDYTFTGTYTQAQGDPLNWVRWQIAYADDLTEPIYDSQEIYGTAQLQVAYDGFFSGTDYAIKCSIETSSGIQADTGWVTFSVEYSTTSLTGYVRASRACGEKSAVYVEWEGIRYIYGEASGDYTIDNSTLNLPTNSSVTWNEVTGSPMSIPTSWNVIYSGKLQKADATLFTVNMGTRVMELTYTKNSRTLDFSVSGSTLASITQVSYDAELTVLVTPTKLYVRRTQLSGGLYPNSTLYPNTTVYPQAETETTVMLKDFSITYPQTAITQIQVSGEQICTYLQVINGTLSDGVINAIYTDGNYDPTAVSGTYFLTDFSKGLNAGSIYIGDSTVEGWAVYRRQQSQAQLKHIVDLPLNAAEVYDYSAASQQGDYVYYIYPIGDTTYITAPLVSNSTNPCFWNWTILECEKVDNYYNLVSEYTFGKNLSSGAISNNNTPNILQNFTRYPTVQTSTSNYLSGSLSSLIGVIDYANGNTYSDTLELRDAIYNLSTTSNTLFLKSCKGDFIQIRISDAITMTTSDGTREQAQTVALPWVQIGDTENVSVVSIPEVSA